MASATHRPHKWAESHRYSVEGKNLDTKQTKTRTKMDTLKIPFTPSAGPVNLMMTDVRRGGF